MAIGQSGVRGCDDFCYLEKEMIKENLLNKFFVGVSNINDLVLFGILIKLFF